MHPYLMIECPRITFPFLRRIVSDVTRDGGFPPLNLETIDFVALYRNEIARSASGAGRNQRRGQDRSLIRRLPERSGAQLRDEARHAPAPRLR